MTGTSNDRKRAPDTILKRLSSTALDQSGILLCRNNDCDVIKAYTSIHLRGKKVLFS